MAVVVGLLLVLLCTQVLGWITAENVNGLQSWLPGVDKPLHILGFAALYAVCLKLAQGIAPGWWSRPPAVALGVAFIAAADEFAQAFVPHRQVDQTDLVASLCGIALAFAGVRRAPRSLATIGIGLAALALAGYVSHDAYAKQVHLNDARRLERAGDFAGARRAYGLALQAGVRTPGLFNELAWVEVESGEGSPEVAVNYARAALAARPDDPDVLDTYGWALHYAGRSAEALPYLERAYQAKPDIFCIHYHLGEVYLALSRTEEAVSHLRRQVALVDTREAARASRTLERLARRPGAGNHSGTIRG